MAAKKTDGGTGGEDVYPGIQAERVQHLNDHDEPTGPDDADGRYVLYWMQQSARASFNHALEFAIHRANDLELPLLVAFGLMDDYPDANARHYRFLLEGLADVEAELGKRDIAFVLQKGEPAAVAERLAKDAALVVVDRGYLRHQRQWREDVASSVGCAVVQVESDVVVPVELVSDHAEHAARTIRPKITQHLDRFLVPLRATRLQNTTKPRVSGEDLSDLDALLGSLTIDHSVPPVPLFTGGTTEGLKVLRAFLKNRFSTYEKNRNQPQTDDVSHMSKYLHYGQLSPVQIALEIKKHSGSNADAYLEELIVRRELPMNFVFYEKRYDSYAAIPDWAKKTLNEHKADERKNAYTRSQLEKAQTHDEYWNAAMREMVHTGYMHNYMRMYWGKKIIEWSSSPETAFRTTLYLNNKYFLDGRDANSFANVSWLFGTHDRGWTERPVLGKVRWMSAGGLESKAKPKEYVEKVDRLVEQVEAESED
ncbi:deoxyribodipyrimidine photo-lyase [Friedmanniella endophytica]|uniref:Deoxyribodipyrimidine photo-lyase n=1 Tax=Microlunatus kandeliicorticis TaxID=1759536 RepID=A0A7W3IT62_9ACTN|nr:deoxyribodipyrimidine photo-lyase [Microlunatus kandeliicorticis]MBA8794798.1 deoxyribodipyrimidine photo-lyase [Microlunatus kandeliicorticis]